MAERLEEMKRRWNENIAEREQCEHERTLTVKGVRTECLECGETLGIELGVSD